MNTNENTLHFKSSTMEEPVKKGLQLLNHMAVNMKYLHSNPMDDNIVQTQYECAKEATDILKEHIDYHEKLYRLFSDLKHHFIFSRAVLSSLFLLGIAKTSSMFSDKDIERLFITSLFKDIGMSDLPLEIYDKVHWNKEENEKFSQHEENSVRILKGRIPLKEHYFKIIENHHCMSGPYRENFKVKNSTTIVGFETILVNVSDIIAGHLIEQPFGKKMSLLNVLAMIKNLMADQHQQEFNIIVSYFRRFL